MTQSDLISQYQGRDVGLAGPEATVTVLRLPAAGAGIVLRLAWLADLYRGGRGFALDPLGTTAAVTETTNENNEWNDGQPEIIPVKVKGKFVIKKVFNVLLFLRQIFRGFLTVQEIKSRDSESNNK